MTNPFQKSSDPLAALQRELADLRSTVDSAMRRPFRVPILAADPPVEDPTDLWMFPDGRLRGRHLNTTGTAFVTREWVTTAPGAATSGTAAAPPTTVPVTVQDTFVAQWTQSYRQSSAARTDAGAVMLYYGSSGDGFNGKNQSLIGFDHAAIAAALAGSTVNAVWLRLMNIHGWYHSGVNVYFGIHNFSSEPASWAGGLFRIVSHRFGKPQERTVPMPLSFATSIRDGTGKGISIEAPNSSKEFYGYAAGVGSGYVIPALIVNYTK